MCDLKNYKNFNINRLANSENINNLLQNITKITPQNISQPHMELSNPLSLKLSIIKNTLLI